MEGKGHDDWRQESTSSPVMGKREEMGTMGHGEMMDMVPTGRREMDMGRDNMNMGHNVGRMEMMDMERNNMEMGRDDKMDMGHMGANNMNMGREDMGMGRGDKMDMAHMDHVVRGMGHEDVGHEDTEHEDMEHEDMGRQDMNMGHIGRAEMGEMGHDDMEMVQEHMDGRVDMGMNSNHED